MTYSAFIKKYVGRYANPDPYVKNQCVDLCNLYFKEVLGTPKISGNAINWDVNYNPKYLRYIKNSRSFIPRAGDVAVFGWKVGRYGHVDIVYSDTTHKPNGWNFWSFSQNWPLYSKCKVVKHPLYYGVKGFLRKR